MLKKIKDTLHAMTQPRYATINARELTELKKTQPDLQILDVRTPRECQKGTLPQATMADVMSPQFKKQVQNLNFHKPILVYCQSGNRSKVACSLLKNIGAEKLYNLAGGYGAYLNQKGNQ